MPAKQQQPKSDSGALLFGVSADSQEWHHPPDWLFLLFIAFILLIFSTGSTRGGEESSRVTETTSTGRPIELIA